jgi:transcriptional regulator with GAF, ATPase, and Fis domain/Tfp pilus assembly protein PilF
MRASIVAHASRRLRTRGFQLVDAAVRTGAPLFREVAMQLGLTTIPVDPRACADAIAAVALTRCTAIVGPLPKADTWDYAVATELSKNSRLLLVYVTDADASLALESNVFDVGAELAPGDKLCWLSAIAESAQTELVAADLRSLEAWWTQARRVVPDARATFDDLSDGARHLLTCLALAGRSLPVAALPAFERSEAALSELLTSGLASRTAGLVSASPTIDLGVLEATASAETRVTVARCLQEQAGSVERDPWTLGRAAELLASVSRFEEADTAIEAALRTASEPQIVSELASRWFDTISPLSSPGSLVLRRRAAERALHQGEAADAQRWCESAAALAPNDPSISMVMCRALMQLGDLVAARVCLSRAEAETATADEELCARVASERAELCYLGGELDLATSHARRASELAQTAKTRLAARATLGKILLARGSFDLADAHFAEDALGASAAGEATAELRARLNRGIALLSKGKLDESRTLLERVLEDGTRLSEERARAYALSNLGLVAYRQRDYGNALQYWERTIRFPQALRGRFAMALTVANLADLRLRLGLVDHAEHAIAFGRRLLSGSTPPRWGALFKWVAAQIALARRNTELARREIESSLVDAQASGDRDCLESAYLVSARVFLEDGDLAHVEEALARATAIATTPRGLAEIAIIRAALLRSMGEPALESANEALRLSRASGEDDLLLEIHTFLTTVHRDGGDLLAAEAHCTRAIAVRDQIAAGLPADVRVAFLAKPETLALSRMQATLASDRETDEEAPRTERSVSRVEANGSREMVGDDPQIRSLAVAIRKVARSNSTVLIRGESGTGKELVADALHRGSDRAAGPLVSVNCAALVETLLLSELFGHEKGAFTGASARRRGRFEMAEGGTLFLDEIGDISPRTQVALLRVLQEKTFERVGGTAPIRANVRVVCATHRDLRAMVERGEFREDLYYRLRGVTLEVPALRNRIGDLPKIADHLLGRIASERGETPKRLTNDAIDLLSRHRWPGNVRELENILRAVSLFADGREITAADVIENVDELRTVARNLERSSGPASQAPISLRSVSILPPPSARDVQAPDPGEAGDDDESGALPEGEANATAVAYAQVRQGAVSLSDIKRQIERDCITRALAETKGNITRAATLLGMKRPRLSQLVKQYGLSVASSEGNQ